MATGIDMQTDPFVDPSEGLDLDMIPLPLERWGFESAPTSPAEAAISSGEAPAMSEPTPVSPEPPRYGFAALQPPPPAPPAPEQPPAPPAQPLEEYTFEPEEVGEPPPAPPPRQGMPEMSFTPEEAGALPAPPMDPETAAMTEAYLKNPEKRAFDASTAAQRQRAYEQTETAKALRDSETRRAAHQATYEREIRRAKLKQVDHDAAAMRHSSKKVDDERWWATRSTGQTIAAFATAIIGGMLSPHRGGKNDGLEMILKEIDQDIEGQKWQLEREGDLLNQQGRAIAEEFARTGDLFTAAETVRIGALESTIKGIKAEAAGLDPKGTQARAAAEAIAGLRAAQAESQMKREEHDNKIATDKANIQIQRGELSARWAGINEQKKERVLKAKTEGFIYDENGNLIPDPHAKQKPLSPQDYLASLRAEEKLLHIDQMKRGKRVIDPTTGEDVGLARYDQMDAVKLAVQQAAYVGLRKDGIRMMELIRDNAMYGGIGSERWPNKARTAYNRLADEMAVKLGKIRDPDSVVREGEAKIAKANLPEIETWTRNPHPGVAYDTIMKSVDDMMEAHLTTRVENYDPSKSPTRHFKAMDAMSSRPQEDTPTETIEKELIAPTWEPETPKTWQGKETAALQRDAAIKGRVAKIETVAERSKGGGLDAGQAKRYREAFAKEFQEGDLSKDEYEKLVETTLALSGIEKWKTALDPRSSAFTPEGMAHRRTAVREAVKADVAAQEAALKKSGRPGRKAPAVGPTAPPPPTSAPPLVAGSGDSGGEDEEDMEDRQ